MAVAGRTADRRCDPSAQALAEGWGKAASLRSRWPVRASLAAPLGPRLFLAITSTLDLQHSRSGLAHEIGEPGAPIEQPLGRSETKLVEREPDEAAAGEQEQHTERGAHRGREQGGKPMLERPDQHRQGEAGES